MKGLCIIALILTLALGVTLAAQEHAKEKKASGEITLPAKLKIGSQMLEPGLYRIACDRKSISFTLASNNKTVLALPCKGREIEHNAALTEVYTDLDKNQVRIVEKLLLRGSNVEHVF